MGDTQACGKIHVCGVPRRLIPTDFSVKGSASIFMIKQPKKNHGVYSF